MVARTDSGLASTYWYNSSVRRVTSSTIHIYVVLMKRYLLLISKNINMILVRLCLAFVYILLIVPYHFFIRRKGGQWIQTEKKIDITFKHMW